MQPTRPVLLAAALTALALLRGLPAVRAAAGAGAAGLLVRCEPCDERVQTQCAPPPSGCAELVREPGCGCCMTCALSEGQPCGVYTERCSTGLRCSPQPGEARPLQALLAGRAVCANASAQGHLSPAPPASGNGSEPEEGRSSVTAASPALTGSYWAPDSKFHPGHPKIEMIKKGAARDSQRYKVMDEAQSTTTQNLAPGAKQDAEYGPCRREMEDTLNRLKSLRTMSPRGLQLPNCDKRGFYKKKQCRPSKGRKRGLCWCVDKYGQPLPGHDTQGRPDVHCDSADSQ